MWDEVWKWLINHHIYNAAVSVAVIAIVSSFIKKLLGSQFARGFLGRYKKIKFGKDGLELEHKDEGNSEKDKEQDNTLSAIIKKLDQINLRLDAQYKYIKEAAVQAGVSVAWSGAKAPFVETVRAILNNMKLGENGNLIDRLAEVVMEQGAGGVKLYRSLLNDFRKDNTKLSTHFEQSIKKVDKKLV